MARTFPVVIDKDYGTKLTHTRTGGMRGRVSVSGYGDRTAVLRNVNTGELVGRAPKTAFGKKRAVAYVRGKERRLPVVQLTRKRYAKVKPYKRKGKRVRGTLRAYSV